MSGSSLPPPLEGRGVRRAVFACRPHRDVIIALGFAYALERIEVDEILLLAGYPPIGRSLLKEYRQANAAAQSAKTLLGGF